MESSVMKFASALVLAASVSGLTGCAQMDRKSETAMAQEPTQDVSRVPASTGAKTRETVLSEIKKIESDESDCSAGDQSQMGMNFCTGDASDKLDTLLNQVYNAKMSSLAPAEKVALRQQERAWIASKTRQLDKNTADSGGSIAPMEENLLIAKLTKARILALIK